MGHATLLMTIDLYTHVLSMLFSIDSRIAEKY